MTVAIAQHQANDNGPPTFIYLVLSHFSNIDKKQPPKSCLCRCFYQCHPRNWERCEGFWGPILGEENFWKGGQGTTISSAEEIPDSSGTPQTCKYMQGKKTKTTCILALFLQQGKFFFPWLSFQANKIHPPPLLRSELSRFSYKIPKINVLKNSKLAYAGKAICKPWEKTVTWIWMLFASV